jgi:predicted CoA-binding protein
MAILTSTADIKRVLSQSKTIAVIGANPKANRPAHYVPEYMKAHGYSVYPVNAAHEGKTLFGETVRAGLGDLEQPVDVVNIFRRSQDVPQHLGDILAMTPLPKVVWLQLGIQNDEVAKALSAAGIEVVQNRCMLADHRRLL